MSISSQFNDLRGNPPKRIGVGLKNFNYNNWEAYINGPRGTPYEGGLFTLDIIFPADYPSSAPKITMKTPIYHPNIDDSGNVCIDIIKGGWKPNYTMRFILNAIVGLLKYPNPDSPWPSKRSVADEFKQDRATFNRKAQDYTSRYAM